MPEGFQLRIRVDEQEILFTKDRTRKLQRGIKSPSLMINSKQGQPNSNECIEFTLLMMCCIYIYIYTLTNSKSYVANVLAKIDSFRYEDCHAFDGVPLCSINLLGGLQEKVYNPFPISIS